MHRLVIDCDMLIVQFHTPVCVSSSLPPFYLFLPLYNCLPQVPAEFSRPSGTPSLFDFLAASAPDVATTAVIHQVQYESRQPEVGLVKLANEMEEI